MNTPQKICIIDDDPFLLDMYSLKFQQSNFEVACFTDSVEAVGSLRRHDHYDAVLIDLVMPKLDGFGLLQTIREENLLDNKTALVILSNQGQDKEIARAEESGIDGYLIKANTLPSEVLEYVKKILQEKQGA